MGNWFNILKANLQFGQNVLLNEHSLRTLPSPTLKYGGSFMQVFTVCLKCSEPPSCCSERPPSLSLYFYLQFMYKPVIVKRKIKIWV